MNTSKTLLSLYLILAVILAQFLCRLFLFKGQSQLSKGILCLGLCISVYLFGYLMIINNNNLQELIFGIRFNIWDYRLFQYYDVGGSSLYKNHLFSKTRMVLLLFLYLLTFFIRLTNSWHHLFYTKWELRQFFGYYSLYMERGFWYYVNIIYTMLCLILTVIIYFREYLKNKTGYTKPIF